MPRLTARTAETAKPGKHGDGKGLWLVVDKAGNRRWVFRFMLRGTAREMGLGSLDTTSLAEARQKAQDARTQLAQRIDPLEARREAEAKARLAAARTMTFKAAAEDYIREHSASWRNQKHAAQWGSTLAAYAYPIIGGLPVADIDRAMVLKILRPIWTEKNETASRVRGRIEAILDWATVHDLRKGDNPARWRGNLDKALPKRASARTVRHHPALPFRQIAGFMADLRQQWGTGARALEFAILTAARTGEVIGAQWQEIDLEAGLWTVAADRMKAQAAHTVPLSPRAVEVLRDMASMDGQDGYVFPGGRKGKPLSNMALTAVLKRMERDDVTVHGFRSTFRDWAAERTRHSPEVVEMALAHTIGSKVEAAYRRGNLLQKRRQLMTDWARYCAEGEPAGDNVTPIFQASGE